VLGAQVSLFDVSDPAHPARLAQEALGGAGSGSGAEYDHQAFLYWAPTGLTVLPITEWPTRFDEVGSPDDGFFGAVGLRVDTAARSLEPVGRITQQDADGAQPWDGRSQILRSLVVGDHVLTVAATGLLQSDLSTLVEQSHLDF
jgi:hypothetical protein